MDFVDGIRDGLREEREHRKATRTPASVVILDEPDEYAPIVAGGTMSCVWGRVGDVSELAGAAAKHDWEGILHDIERSDSLFSERLTGGLPLMESWRKAPAFADLAYDGALIAEGLILVSPATLMYSRVPYTGVTVDSSKFEVINYGDEAEALAVLCIVDPPATHEVERRLLATIESAGVDATSAFGEPHPMTTPVAAAVVGEEATAAIVGRFVAKAAVNALVGQAATKAAHYAVHAVQQHDQQQAAAERRAEAQALQRARLAAQAQRHQYDRMSLAPIAELPVEPQGVDPKQASHVLLRLREEALQRLLEQED